MNILYCGDGNITDGIFMSAFSLAKNTDEKLDIFILTAEIAERNFPIPESFAEKLEKKINEKNRITFVVCSDDHCLLRLQQHT